MIYIGIDPGKKGAWAVIRSEGVFVFPWDEMSFIAEMDTLKHSVDGCVLEHVGAMPGQGVTSMFHFGENFGFIQGVLRAYGIPYELVRPQRWKKEFGITSDKNTSIAVAQRLFPAVDFRRTDRCRKPDDGMAEAALMALYAKRKMRGKEA